MAVYLDCNATTPVESSVFRLMSEFTEKNYGNAASMYHDFGVMARTAADIARRHIAGIASARPDEVIFTSGATESNNLAILGLAKEGMRTGRKHIITTAAEHKSVLETFEALEQMGFEADILPVDSGGRTDTQRLRECLRPDTLLVSVMHVNNETGVIQPLGEILEVLESSDALFHTDAAQGFGKELSALKSQRIDMISVSGHKMYAPKGVGALIMRRRNGVLPPVSPLFYGGGQEHGLRPGTLPVQLIAGFGEAAKLAVADNALRIEKCLAYREKVMSALAELGAVVNGEEISTVPHTVNVFLEGIRAESAIKALAGVAAVSAVSACTSHKSAPSHVLDAMGMSEERALSSLRFSWCHMTPDADWDRIVGILKNLRGG
jgi:cysteine desulfurase